MNLYTNTNLCKKLFSIIELDTISEWGKRDITYEGLRTLHHFEWNSRKSGLSTNYFEYPISKTKRNDNLDVELSVCLEKKHQDADAWKLVSIAASIDFITGRVERDIKESTIYELAKGRYADGFSHYYNETMCVFHSFSILFYKYNPVFDEYELMKNYERNAGNLCYVV